MKRHPAGVATYPGDVRSIIGERVGELKGPTTYGAVVVAESAAFDGVTTRVTFGHATNEDIQTRLVELRGRVATLVDGAA